MAESQGNNSLLPFRYVNACLCISRRGGPWMPIASRGPAVVKQTSGLKLVVVDGLPSIVDHVDDEPRVLEQFSKLARDLDVAVVLTDLATRGPLRKPGLGNLINGKAECRYADAILFVYRPEFKCACGGDANKAEIMVLKHPWIQPYTLNSVSSPNTRDSRITDLLRPDAQFW